MATILNLKRPTAAERRAIEFLAEHLPEGYHLTTPARDIGGKHDREREVDGILVSEAGILVLEYKNLAGRVQPTTYGPWKRTQGRSPGKAEQNPFEQADNAAKRLANYLKDRTKTGTLPCFIDYLIVLTHPRCTLDTAEWAGNDADEKRVCLLSDAPGVILQRLNGDPVFSGRDIQSILDVLAKPGILSLALDRNKPAPATIRRASIAPEIKPSEPESWRERFREMNRRILERRG